MIAVSLLAAIAAAGAYYYYDQHHTGRRHGVGVEDLSCADSVVFSLRLELNGKPLWNKTHAELLVMPEAVPSQDNRFRDKNIMPLTALLKDHPKVKSIEAIPCDADSVIISPEQVLNGQDNYYLGQNQIGRMKVMQQVSPYKHLTILRNVVAINLIE